jgi:hypothetical protein
MSVALICCVGGLGRSPMRPDANWTFCAAMAADTSAGESASAAFNAPRRPRA